MQLNVDLMELLLALLVLVGIVFGVFLIIFLARLIQTMKNISKLTADIHDPVTQTVDQLPDLMKKIDSIVEDVDIITGSANTTVPGILDDAKTMTGTVRSGVEAVGSAAESVSDGVSSIFGKAKDKAESFSSILEVVGQVMSIVGIFTHREKKKEKRRPFGRRRS